MGILEERSAARPASPAAVPGYAAVIRALFFCVCLGVATAQPALAQTAAAPGQPAAPQSWQSLSPQQQQLLHKYQDNWNSLPPGRQQALATGSQRWLSMSPEQRSGAQQRFNQWRQLAPEQRQAVRQRWQEYKSLPPEQQQRVRESYQRFRQMPPERRSELRRQWHQMTPEQKRNFHHKPPEPHPKER